MKYKTYIITAITAFNMSSLHGQDNPADPYRSGAPTPATVVDERDKHVYSICYETFSLPLAMAAKIRREISSDTILYMRIVEAVEKEKARQESFTVLRAKSGQSATTESISEQIYATEYEPPAVPNTVGISIMPAEEKTEQSPTPDTSKLKDAADISSYTGLKTPALPTSFETRNVGVVLEIEPMLSSDLNTLDIRIAPEHVTFAGQTTMGQGLSQVEFPLFEIQSLSTALSFPIGQPFLLGTVSRPPNSEADPDSATRVWFAFVTATLAEP